MWLLVIHIPSYDCEIGAVRSADAGWISSIPLDTVVHEHNCAGLVVGRGGCGEGAADKAFA